MERKFDRLVHFDERSRSFPIRTLIRPKEPVTRIWRASKVFLDQGQEGACVGFGWTHELGSTPIRYSVDENLARKLYHEARKLDDFPGEDYEGTSVLGGAKAATSLGFVNGYRWAFGLSDVLLALSFKGPVVLGTNWYSGMFSTDDNGLIHVEGDNEGGHCLLAHGLDTFSKRVLLRNSWGKDWGVNGGCWISWADLDRLLHEDGEACIPIDKSQIKT